MLYADYSEPFFGGDYKVLRGGSWAVGGASIRPSFRNWDLPIRRQIFTGLRLAWDVPVMCRHLAWLGEPRTVSLARARARARAAAAVLRSRGGSPTG